MSSEVSPETRISNWDAIEMEIDMKKYLPLQLGRGSFGMVFAGKVKATGVKIALKMGTAYDMQKEHEIAEKLAGNASCVQVFGLLEPPQYTQYTNLLRQFTKCLENKQLENVTKIIDSNLLNYKWIVMERALSTLSSFITKDCYSAGLPAVNIIKLCTDLAAAMKYFQEKNIAHRDIKPDNILVFRSGLLAPQSEFLFKLTDFGASKAVPDGEDVSGRNCNTVVGTLGYLEFTLVLAYFNGHRRTAQKYSGQTIDLWSGAVTICLAATGRMPFPGYNERTKLSDKRRQELTEILADEQQKERVIGCTVDIERLRKLSDSENISKDDIVYYKHICNRSYPRWLRLALSDMIIESFKKTACYGKFFKMCDALGNAAQHLIVKLPSFEIYSYAVLDKSIFSSAISLFDEIDISSASTPVMFTKNGIITELPSTSSTIYVQKDDICTGLKVVEDAPPEEPGIKKSNQPLRSILLHVEQCRNIINAWNQLPSNLLAMIAKIVKDAEDLKLQLPALNAILRLNTTSLNTSYFTGDDLTSLSKNMKEIERQLVDMPVLRSASMPNCFDLIDAFLHDSEIDLKHADFMDRKMEQFKEELRNEIIEKTKKLAVPLKIVIEGLQFLQVYKNRMKSTYELVNSGIPRIIQNIKAILNQPEIVRNVRSQTDDLVRLLGLEGLLGKVSATTGYSSQNVSDHANGDIIDSLSSDSC